jgi:uncharacterized membrane protein
MSISTIDVPGASSSGAFHINDVGQIVGGFGTGSFPTGPYHGFLLSGGSYTQLDLPGTVSGTTASGINASGQIVGSWGGITGLGFLLTGGTYTTIKSGLGLVPEGTWASGINDSGQIVGGFSALIYNHVQPPIQIVGGFLFSRGIYTELGSLLRESTTPDRSC